MASIDCTSSDGSSSFSLARSCFMCAALDVPVSGSIPTARAKLKMIWAGVAFNSAANSISGGCCDHFRIRGEQRESLISDLALVAEGSYFAIPAQARKAAILHKRGKLSAGSLHLLQMLKRNVAHSQQPCAAGVAFLPHRLPDFPVGLAPLKTRGPVQNVTVHVVGREVLEGTGHRLRHLNRQTRRRIVRQSVILPAPVSEFSLQKQIRAGDDPRPVSGRQAFAHTSFRVMPALVGGIDPAKSRDQRHSDQRSGPLFLPRGTIKKCRKRRDSFGGHRVIVPRAALNHRGYKGSQDSSRTLSPPVLPAGEVFCSERNDGIISAGYILYCL